MKDHRQGASFFWKRVRKRALVLIFLTFSITLLHSFVPHTHDKTCKSGFTQKVPVNPWLMWLTIDLGVGHLGQYEGNEQGEEESIPSIYFIHTNTGHTSAMVIDNLLASYHWPAIFLVKIKKPPGNYFSLRAPPSFV